MAANTPAPHRGPIGVEARRSFDAEAERYAATRPTYPAALFDEIAAYGGLMPTARVIEAGPGTGQATRSLAERGWDVTAVELSERLAEVARRRLADHPAARIIVSAFEEWEPPAEPFDLFVCATAFHWLDPAMRVAQAASTLRAGGTAAIVWTHHVAGGSPGFFERSQHCFERFEPGTPIGLRLPLDDAIEPATSEFAASPLFTDIEDRRFAVELGYTAESYADLLRTYSNVLALPADLRQRLLNCVSTLIREGFGGAITKRYLFELVLARRTDRPAV